MSGEADGPRSDPDRGDPAATVEALRAAVERTLSATAGSATEARQRARELLDEVARRGEAARGEVARRGGAAREQVDRRSQAARQRLARGRDEAAEELARRGEAVGSRLSEAVAELRASQRTDLGPVKEGLAAIENRLEELERALRARGRAPDPSSDPAEGPQAKPRPEAESGPADRRSDAETRD